MKDKKPFKTTPVTVESTVNKLFEQVSDNGTKITFHNNCYEFDYLNVNYRALKYDGSKKIQLKITPFGEENSTVIELEAEFWRIEELYEKQNKKDVLKIIKLQ